VLSGGAHSGISQSTFQGCLDRLAIANPCYERGVAYINATAATLIHRLTLVRLIPLKPEVRSVVVSTSAFESERHWFESASGLTQSRFCLSLFAHLSKKERALKESNQRPLGYEALTLPFELVPQEM
jgi:hypothetical protein